MSRDKLIREMFEMSREIGYRQFHAENFNRADPVLMQLTPEARQAFLRDWWDAARDRMYEGYREQVAGHGMPALLNMREAYIDTLDALGMLEWRRDKHMSDQESFQRLLKDSPEGDDKPQEKARTPDKGMER